MGHFNTNSSLGHRTEYLGLEVAIEGRRDFEDDVMLGLEGEDHEEYKGELVEACLNGEVGKLLNIVYCIMVGGRDRSLGKAVKVVVESLNTWEDARRDEMCMLVCKYLYTLEYRYDRGAKRRGDSSI